MSQEPWRPRLRDAVPEDVPELARLDRVCFQHYAYPARLFDRFIQLGQPFVVAEDPATGNIAGFAMIMPEPGEGTGILITLDVTPDRRRRGLGTSMVAWCARALTDLEPPIGLMWLTVASRNAGARAFYGILGFSEVDAIEDYYGDDDAVVMVHLDTRSLAKLSLE